MLTGAELAQIYAATYPLQVSGLALLDGYSNTDRLLRVANDDIFKATQVAHPIKRPYQHILSIYSKNI